jgi:hypothetical protein
MIPVRETFLNLRHLPARVSAQEAAWLLGFEEHDMPALVKKRILKPLGNPAQNCVKKFHLVDVLNLAADRKELAKASDAVRRGGKKVCFPAEEVAAFTEAA